MLTRTFINRVKEFEFLKNDLEKRYNRSRIIAICASTGIGKSSLVDKVVHESKYDLDHRVKIKLAESKDCEPGFFLRKIIKLLDSNSFNSNLFNYPRFYEFIAAKNDFALIGESVVKKFLSPVGLDDFINQSKAEESKVDNWLGNELDLLLLGRQYIEYILNERFIVLAIENCQDMDDYSARTIREIAKLSSNSYFYFEYTISKKFNISFEDLCEYYNIDSIMFSAYHLDKLDKKEIIQTLRKKEEIVIGILNDTYEKSDGNLFKLSLLLNVAANSNIHKNLAYEETIKNIIINFRDSLKILFLVIVSHRGIISRPLLNIFIQTHLYDLFNYQELDNSLNCLLENNLIEYNDNAIKIAHDSLFFEINISEELKKYHIIVLRRLCEFYLEMNQDKKSVEERIDNYLYIILFLLKLNSYSEIINILKEINICLRSFPINKVISYIDLIRITYNENKLDSEFDNELDKWLTFIYFQCGYFDRIITNLSFESIIDDKMRLCYIAALSSEIPEIALPLIKKSRTSENTMYNLGLKLVELRTLRSLGNVHECYKKWFKYYNNNIFKNTLLEGDFLRYSCLCIHDDLNFRIERIIEAHNLFIKHNNIYGIISSSMTLMRDYAFIKNNDKVLYWANEMNRYAQNAIFPMCQIYNNLSSLDIINNKISAKTLFNLYKSLDICTNTSDSISIKSNLLCCYLLKQDIKGGTKIYLDLLSVLKNKYSENSLIIQATIYNCYKYSVLLQDHENLEFLKDQYMKFEKLYRSGNTLLSTKKCQSVPNIIQRNCYPVLMVNWDVDYYNVLNNY